MMVTDPVSETFSMKILMIEVTQRTDMFAVIQNPCDMEIALILLSRNIIFMILVFQSSATGRIRYIEKIYIYSPHRVANPQPSGL
jgi:hypothetical protein